MRQNDICHFEQVMKPDLFKMVEIMPNQRIFSAENPENRPRSEGGQGVIRMGVPSRTMA